MENELPQEGLIDQQTDTATDSAPETNQTQESESSTDTPKEDEKPKAFHEDPRIQDYINRQVESRTAKVREEVEESISSKFSPKEETKIPSWFGGGDDQWKEFESYLSTLTSQAKADALREIKTEQEAQEKRVKEATDWFNESVSEIEKEYGTKLSESAKNKLLKQTSEAGFIDSQGRWNYKATFKYHKALEKPDTSLEDKRQTASLTVSEPKAESTDREIKVPSFLRRKR